MRKSRYVVFLRGINVGGRLLLMAELKLCFEKMGFKNVSTLLQSGNVVFDPSTSSGQEDVNKLKQKIEATLTTTFNYPAKAQVHSLASLKNIVESYPFGTAGNDQHDYVIFLENGLEKSLINEKIILSPGEKVKTGKDVIYWRVDKGSTLKSSFAKLLTRAKYKDFNTNRNLKTLKKLLN